jgi:hypothetical protein
VTTLRQDLEALGVLLELVAVFDGDGDRRVPIHLGKEPLRDPPLVTAFVTLTRTSGLTRGPTRADDLAG